MEAVVKHDVDGTDGHVSKNGLDVRLNSLRGVIAIDQYEPELLVRIRDLLQYSGNELL